MVYGMMPVCPAYTRERKEILSRSSHLQGAFLATAVLSGVGVSKPNSFSFPGITPSPDETQGNISLGLIMCGVGWAQEHLKSSAQEREASRAFGVAFEASITLSWACSGIALTFGFFLLAFSFTSIGPYIHLSGAVFLYLLHFLDTKQIKGGRGLGELDSLVA